MINRAGLLQRGESMRILLIIEYDGTNYAGWQRQTNAKTVQEELENAVCIALSQKCVVYGAGRTDAGVHALAQCAHFDCKTTIPPEKIAYALNLVLPEDIRVRDSYRVADDFHARFSAHGKHYRYAVYCAPHACAINRAYCHHIRGELNVEAMKAAAAYLVGKHDFAAFQASGSEVKDTVRTIERLDVSMMGAYLFIEVIGNGFLYNMVRIIAGTLLDVGRGRYSAARVKEILESKDRENAGATAPAKGLTLIEVVYGLEILK